MLESLVVWTPELGIRGHHHNEECTRLHHPKEITHKLSIVFDMLEDIEEQHSICNL